MFTDNKFACEHCGTQVIVSNVCATCGRDHSDEWLESNRKTDSEINFTSIIVMLISFPYYLYKDSTVNIPSYYNWSSQLETWIGQIFFPSIIFAVCVTIGVMLLSWYLEKKS